MTNIKKLARLIRRELETKPDGSRNNFWQKKKYNYYYYTLKQIPISLFYFTMVHTSMEKIKLLKINSIYLIPIEFQLWSINNATKIIIIHMYIICILYLRR